MEYIVLELQGTVPVNGESTLTGFTNFIECKSFSHGVSNPLQPTTSNTGRTTGRPNIRELTVSKNLDSTTPLLNFYCAQAKNLGTTRLHLARQDANAGGAEVNAADYMVYEMTNTMVSSVSIGGGGGGIPQETISLNFSKITWTYKKQKMETGEPGQIVNFWDQQNNTGG